MERNIVLLFLSDVKTNTRDDEIFVSEAHYENIAGENTKTTNESAIRYLLEKFPIDKIFIFASKKVRKEIKDYRDKDGKPCSHLDFSLERFKEFFPGDDRYFVFDYDEDGSDNDNLKSLAEMAKHIQEFAEGEKVTLHVDLTGGMRHVNMMMLELTRLLEYSGLTIGKILYSNYKKLPESSTVEEIQNVYDLFQLMAGVEEFVNFGSVKALKLYYADKKISEPLKKLRDAMESFAEAIKLCHYGQFNEAIENLHDAVHDFNKHISDDVEDILMARLIGRIQENYQELIAARKKDDLRVIRWCLDNDYLQQALTLYTERIPEYLGEKDIISQTEAEAKKLAELVGKEDVKYNLWFYLFSKVKPQEKSLEKGKFIFCKAIKDDAWAAIRSKTFNFDEWLAALNQKLAPFSIHCEDEPAFRAQFEILAKIFQDPSLLKDLSSPELDPIRKILDALDEEFKSDGRRIKVLTRFFSNTITLRTVPKYFFGSSFIMCIEKYPKAFKLYELLNQGIFSVHIPKENFLSIVDKYFRIKDERNHSAHALEDYGEFRTAKRLRTFMYDALKEIEDNLPAK